MEARIGNRLVSTLRPKEKFYQVHDTEIKGFILRVQPSGVMTYGYNYYLPSGRRDWIKIGRHGNVTPEQARDRAKQIAADVVKGIDPKAQKNALKIPSFEIFFDHIYRPWAASHLKSGAVYYKRLKSRFKFLIDKSIDDPKLPWLIEKWKTERLKDGVMKATVNRDLATLKGALSYGVRQKNQTGLIRNPIVEVKLLRVPQDESERERYLNQRDPEEEKRLFEAIEARDARIKAGRESGNAWREQRGYEQYPSLTNLVFADHLQPMIELTMNTGLRRGELFQIRWSDLSLSLSVLTIRGSISKNGRSRSIPLNRRAVEVLRAWSEQLGDTSGLVFPGEEGRAFTTLKTAWTNLRDEAKLVDFRWHDFRHTFASNLVIAGVSRDMVQDLLGHQDAKMTKRYAHLSPQVKADAVAKLDLPRYGEKNAFVS